MSYCENPTAGGLIHRLFSPRRRKAKANRANWLKNATSEPLECRRLMSANFTSLHSLSQGPAGYAPWCSLVRDSSGNLYGTTQWGGVYGNGTIFELSGANDSTYTILVSFTGFTGSYSGLEPEAGLVLDSSGNLYGTTSTGGLSGYGTIFELAANHTTFTTLVSFTGKSGGYPGYGPSALTIDSNSNLYGTTYQGGTSGYGTIFELSANHTAFTSLVSLTGNSGSYPGDHPDASLILDSSGNMYGTTVIGGSSGDGNVFELSANHTAFTSLVSFDDGGSYPGSGPMGLTIDRSGNLYGITESGGTSDYGTIFELRANHISFTSLVSFTGSSGSYLGCYPHAGLALDSSGNMYGTTLIGGSSGDGNVFELSADHTTFASLVSFTGNSGSYLGYEPEAGLILDSSGNLYGDTYGGGIYGNGTVFEISMPAQLAFASGPTNTAAGSTIDSPSGVRVSVETSGGAVVSGDTDTVTLSLGSNPGGATLSGTLTATAVNGIATFTNLSLNNIGSGYTLVATDASTPSLATATSAPFSVGSATTTVSAGNTMTIPASNFSPTVMVTGSLSISGSTNNWTGKLNITNNDLDIIGGSLSTITNIIQQGFNGGNWQGNGITSSTAASDPNHLTAVGVIQNNQNGTPMYSASNQFDGTTPGASDILVKYTYYGDCTLSGSVNGTDYGLIDYAYGYNQQHPSTPLTGWGNGDFNYDGHIDGSDYTLIDNSFNMQSASLADEIATPAVQIAAKGKQTASPVFQTRTAISYTPPMDENIETSLQNKDVLDRLASGK